MSTWILRLDAPGTGPRVAIKDLIDVAGTPTTAGSRVLAATAEPATNDASCLAGLRAADAVIVGKANLHELACGGTGINPHFGTPVNPFDPDLIPGGSSSGNAVALANHEVDLAIGSDTAGSIRTPSACCGTVGLKPTWGRVSTIGVWPLAPSLDSVGPMARDVQGVIDGMALLDPDFSMTEVAAATIGRVRLPNVDPVIDAAIDDLLATSEIEVIDIELAGWNAASDAALAVMLYEVWRVDRPLYERDAAGLGDDVRERLEQGRGIADVIYRAGLARQSVWRTELAAAFERAPVLAWPTLARFPARLDDPSPDTRRTNIAVNLAGHPSLALPVPAAGPIPASVQLIGPDRSENLLCSTGLVLEAAGPAIR